MSEWLRYVLAVALGLASAWITFRLRFERFEARDAEREKAWWVWRNGLDAKISEREEQSQRNAEELHRLEEIVKALKEELTGLHKWKHVVGDAYLPRGFDEHERRLNRLDAKVWNGDER